MTLTKKEIADFILAQQSEIGRPMAKQIVYAFFDTISDALARGEEVKLTGFGNFLLRVKKARPGRNPKTLENVMISGRRVTTFKASQKMRRKVTRGDLSGDDDFY